MTIQILTTQPAEKGTAIVTVTPTDENGNSLSFSQLGNPQWQLMHTDGTVIDGCAFGDNDLTSLSWVLSGSDLAIFGDSGIRVLTFKATYDSDAGSELPLKSECRFKIQPLLGIPDET